MHLLISFKHIFICTFICAHKKLKETSVSGRTRIRARVLFDYVPTQPDELRLLVGEFVFITEKNLDDEGWFRGECCLTGAVGVFPDNFVEELPDMAVSQSPNSVALQSHSKSKVHQSSESLARAG